MPNIKFFQGEAVPVEMHKPAIVQKLTLPTVERRLEALKEAGNNSFLLENKDIFLDMLTDSGVNAMSSNQLAAMMEVEESYSGSGSFTKLANKINEIFGMKFFLPVHQGRAAEHVLAVSFIKPGNVIPMNFHFTTAKAHITCAGGRVVELVPKSSIDPTFQTPFKGNFDTERLKDVIRQEGAKNIPFIRLEAGTNLIGGQPLSLENIKDVCNIAKANGILTVLDASLWQDNLYFIKTREESCRDMSLREITKEMSSVVDIIYFSARKLGFARGGGICMRDESLYGKMREYITLFEGMLSYGGMSLREVEAITVGLDETMEMDTISHGPEFTAFMCGEFQKRGVPVVTPPGGLGCHLDAMRFLDHIPQNEYPAGALTAAVYLAGAIRGMERGTMSEQRDEDGSEHFAEMELLRLALPRRVFTLSHVHFAVDRVCWLFEHRRLVGGLRFVEEPSTLRFFFGKLEPIGNWQEELAKQYRKDFGDSL